MIQIASFLSIGLSVERVPCFTALRVRVSTECCHTYASDVFSEKFREHVFFAGSFLKVNPAESRKHGNLAIKRG